MRRILSIAVTCSLLLGQRIPGPGGTAPASGGGTVSLVGTFSTCNNVASGVTCTITTTSATPGHLLVVLIQYNAGTGAVTAVTDSSSNTGLQAGATGNASLVQCQGQSNDIWYIPNISASQTTIT